MVASSRSASKGDREEEEAGWPEADAFVASGITPNHAYSVTVGAAHDVPGMVLVMAGRVGRRRVQEPVKVWPEWLGGGDRSLPVSFPVTVARSLPHSRWVGS